MDRLHARLIALLVFGLLVPWVAVAEDDGDDDEVDDDEVIIVVGS